MTLLEVLLTTALLATIVTAVSIVLRSSYAAWQAQEGDSIRLQSLHASLRHLVREIRQASEVTAITAASNSAGSISLLMHDGATHVWARDAGTNEIRFGVGSADHLLGEEITALRFTGYAADGVTATTDVDAIHAIRCTATTVLPRDTGGERTVSCWAWIRAS